MLIKRTHLFLEVMLGLFVAYLLIMRLFIIGLQSYPQQSLSFFKNITGWQVELSTIELEQTWLGARFNLQGVSLSNQQFDLQADKIVGDINIFAPMIPVLSFGDSLRFEQLSVRNLQPQDEPVVANVPDIAELSSAYQGAMDFLRSQKFTKRMWQKVSVDSLIMNGFLNSATSVIQIDRLDLVKASQINLVAEFSVRYKEALNFERFSTNLAFTPNSWGGLSHGSVRVISYQPLSVKRLAALLPSKWVEVLPKGEVLLDWQTDFKDSKVSHSVVHLNAQALDWRENNEVLPKSVGLELSWNPALDQVLGKNLANFHLTKVQLDNQFVETLSPIKLTVANEKELVLSAEKFDIQPFKEMLRVFVETRYLSDLLSKAVELQVSDFALRLNWRTLDVPMLKMHLARLGIPLTEFPGVAAQDVTLVKFDKQFRLETTEPVWVLEPKIYPLPMRVSLPPAVQSHYVDQQYDFDPFDFQLNDFDLKLERFRYQQGEWDIEASLTVDEAEQILPYLPHKLMGASLNKWLEDADIKGGKTAVKVVYQSSPQEVDSAGQTPLAEYLKGLRLHGVIENAQFEFNSKWPAVANTDLTFEFKDNRIAFESKAVGFAGVSAPIKAKAVISDVTEDDIGLQVSGTVSTSLTEMAAFAKKTPLPEKLGLQSYLQQPEKLQGAAALELKRIWIPLFGHGRKDEQVSGRLHLKNARLDLPDLPELQRVRGTLEFSEKALSAKNVKLTVYESPAVLGIETDQKRKQLVFDLAGESQYRSEPYFSKPIPYQLRFSVPTDESGRPVQFSGNVFVNQAESKMPQPFSTKDIIRPLELTGQIDDQLLSANLISRDIVQADFIWSLDKEKFLKLQGYVGDMVDAQRDWGGRDSFVRGQLKSLDAFAWWRLWEGIPDSGQEKNPLDEIEWQNTEFFVKALNYKEQQFNNARVVVQSLDANLDKITLQSDEVDAAVLIPEEGVIEVTADKLYLKSKSENAFAQGSSDICPLETSDVDYPELKFNARNVHFGEYLFDQLGFDVVPIAEGYEAKNLQAQMHNNAGQISGNYRFDQVKNLSAARLNLQSKNIVELLKTLGISQGIKAKEAWLHSEVSWFGGVDCFSIKDLFGKMDFRLEDGVVKDVEPGFARLLGLLSVDSLARRLRLQLDDVTNKGLVFDDIKGQGLLNESRLQLQSFKLSAPAAKVDMQGDILLDEERFDLRANVTPSVGSSLPTIAALAGMANPITALAVYTLMKVIPDINENLITYEYEISGPWKEPRIELKEKASKK
ncbi:YhdP family protein [Thiomicrorhabdus sp. 6S3-12]|uniref:YhdP family phospholipid transporter n=1 Tax=Thiomicrorhabdus sp. 6S3-12 TaxID=2819681 RepID=UPI001AADFA00|nr:AsmA-like C-terminal region-containing protein [Thiomicrorhabdus sp. 6S3-12]MBO1923727.1 hypothetical protein [Thiomicrorhabdus sp. 6S3-12]